MNEFKGTNSDWKEAGHNDNGIFISGESKQDAIAFIYYNNNTVAIGEGKANARLIANAKRMYDLLNDASNAVEDIDYRQQTIDLLNEINKEI